MDKEKSLRQQRAAGTLERNKAIRFLARNGMTLAEIGKKYNIRRQRVHQIVNSPTETAQDRRETIFSRLFRVLYFRLKRWFCYR